MLRAVAYSRTDLESRPAEITLTYSAPLLTKPVLHVLAVGINDYRDTSLALSYARPDAEAMAAFFSKQAQARGLFRSVNTTQLVDKQATGAAIRAALTQVGRESQPEDVVIVYLAGHGETAPLTDEPNAEETFFFLPTEMRQIALKERVRALGISGREIDTLLAQMKARKIVLIYDACKSGAALQGGVRGSAEEQQALALLARAQGIHVLTASTDQQYANEVQALGHGVLTYALLEALSGKASKATNGLVMVRELMSYVEDRVPELTRQYRGREQWPVPFDRGQNFPLASRQ